MWPPKRITARAPARFGAVENGYPGGESGGESGGIPGESGGIRGCFRGIRGFPVYVDPIICSMEPPGKSDRVP